MERFDPESTDLAELARGLRVLPPSRLVGSILGRTQLRDAVVATLGCSQLEGERLVDTMVARGFLVREKQADGLVHWTVRVEAE